MDICREMRKKEAKIVIVDDDKDILFAARIWLKKFFTQVVELDNPRKILNELSDGADVVLLDMNFRKGFEDGKDGLYWLKEIQNHFEGTPVVLMTAYGEVDLAVAALKQGASDFVLKPWNKERLYASINMAVDLSRKNKKIDQWKGLQKPATTNMLASRSPLMKELLRTVEKVAPTDANVLITGENGTGKYIMAEHIHYLSKRRKEPFVHIDLGSLTESLFESELFGYVKGAFTDAKENTAGKIEAANGGTIFLDEIANLPLRLQTKLLTLIQNRKISRLGETKERNLNVRFIFATNEHLPRLIEKQLFRNDLFFRINTVELNIPPLRERTEDINIFVQHFKMRYEKKYNKENLFISNMGLEKLVSYNWPGNIRELDHAIERAIIMSESDEIEINLYQVAEPSEGSTLNIEEMEAHLIRKAMKKYQGNISSAAEALGLSRAALYRRLEKFNL